jgi:hypothetical protein
MTPELAESIRGPGAETVSREKAFAASARLARLALEREIFRPHLVRQNIRFEPSELQRIDDERRVPSSEAVPSRAAMIRQLIREAIAFRRANRSPPRPAKGVPFEIDI